MKEKKIWAADNRSNPEEGSARKKKMHNENILNVHYKTVWCNYGVSEQHTIAQCLTCVFFKQLLEEGKKTFFVLYLLSGGQDGIDKKNIPHRIRTHFVNCFLFQ